MNDLARWKQLSADDAFTAATLRPSDHCCDVTTRGERHVHRPTEIVQVEMRKEWHTNWARAVEEPFATHLHEAIVTPVPPPQDELLR